MILCRWMFRQLAIHEFQQHIPPLSNTIQHIFADGTPPDLIANSGVRASQLEVFPNVLPPTKAAGS